jgi:antitoxin (DNA-binding transcriptional repressor) of toxin-antitoxin stability system
MARLDLDELPPKIAAQLAALEAGEVLVLVQHGAVVGRLTAGPAEPAASAEPALPPEQEMKEVFENFRASIEDEF